MIFFGKSKKSRQRAWGCMGTSYTNNTLLSPDLRGRYRPALPTCGFGEISHETKHRLKLDGTSSC
jgi:hypothetical protein